MRIVLLPQAFRVMLPAIISQLVVVLKDTSLVTFVANFDELLSNGESIQRNLDNPIQTFTVIALLYIAINYTLGRIAQYIQKRQARAGRSTTEADVDLSEGVQVGAHGRPT
jgi:glutamate transport system permease protein